MCTLLVIHNEHLLPGGELEAVRRSTRYLSSRHTVVSCPFSSREWADETVLRKITQPFRIFYNPDAARRLNDALDRHQPDALVCHNLYPVASPAVYAVALRRGIPVVQFLHNYRPLSISGLCRVGTRNLEGSWPGVYAREILNGSWNHSRFRTLLLGTALIHLRLRGWTHAVGAWAGVSEFVTRRMAGASLAPGRLHTLRHAWDPAPGTPLPVAEEDYHLYLGRLSHEKGVDVLLRAWELLQQEGNAPRLIIAGDGPLKATLEQTAARLQLPVEFTGWVEGPEKARLIAGSRALIAPSVVWEALGLIVYEAYEQARPVLAAAAGGLSEVVQPGETGYLHPPGNARALADDVRNLDAVAPARRAEMGRAGRQWLTTEARPEVWLDQFDRMLETLPGF